MESELFEPKCKHEIGCHACVNFMQSLEARMMKFLEASEKDALPNMTYEAQNTLTLIRAFRNGEPSDVDR